MYIWGNKMKKVLHVLSVFIIVLCLVVLTSCGTTSSKQVDVDQDFEVLKASNLIDGKTLIGVLSVEETKNSSLPSGHYHKLIQSGNVASGSYVFVYVDGVATLDSSYSYPSIDYENLHFSGIYNKEYNRVTSFQSDDFVYVRYISFLDSLFMSLVCILIVFFILVVLYGLVSLFKIFDKKKKDPAQVKEVEQVETKKIKPEDIADEDMMVASLIASIDYHEKTKKDVRVVSIREIK